MSKFDTLWIWIKENGSNSFKLSFQEIESIAGVPIDHSFLKYKKELLQHGYMVSKISTKEKIVSFEKNKE